MIKNIRCVSYVPQAQHNEYPTAWRNAEYFKPGEFEKGYAIVITDRDDIKLEYEAYFAKHKNMLGSNAKKVCGVLHPSDEVVSGWEPPQEDTQPKDDTWG